VSNEAKDWRAEMRASLVRQDREQALAALERAANAPDQPYPQEIREAIDALRDG